MNIVALYSCIDNHFEYKMSHNNTYNYSAVFSIDRIAFKIEKIVLYSSRQYQMTMTNEVMTQSWIIRSSRRLAHLFLLFFIIKPRSLKFGRRM